MLKTTLYVSLASLGLVTSAIAADLPTRSAPPIFTPPPSPTFRWTGLYVGGNAGHVWNSGNTVQTFGNDAITNAQLAAPATVPSSQGLKASGITAGGQLGYNYQIPTSLGGGLVLGVEADGAYTDLNANAQALGFGNLISQYHSQLDYLGTVRGRAGIAFDRVLIYGTGGFAYGHVTLADSISPPAVSGLTGALWAGRNGHTETGYAVGGGIEFAIPTASLLNPLGAGAVTLRAEYLHYDLGTLNLAVPAATFGPPGTSFSDRIRTAGDLVRGGINYKFDFSPPAAVVARY